MADVAKRSFGNPGSISQSHRDVTDERYRDLRRPRKVKFYCNGDRYFKGKRLFITPHRYLTFNDLLNDLTGKLPSSVPLPYGVRSIYTPCGGKRIKDIDELQDGGTYVCGGFEVFKQIQYGKEALEPWLAGAVRKSLDPVGGSGIGYTLKLSKKSKTHKQQQQEAQDSLYGSYNYGNNFGNPYNRAFHGGFQPSRSLRNTYPKRPGYGYNNTKASGYGNYGQNESGSMKPKVVTVIRNGNKPRNNVKILLNRRSVQSYEQLVKDISEAFGPKWKNNKVRRLFSVRGREVHGVSDFFRDDDVFIAVGNDSLTTNDVGEILEELYPESPYAKNLMKEWEKTKKKQQQNRLKPDESLKDAEASKVDSGLGSDESARDEGESVEPPPAKSKEKKKKKKPYEIQDDDLVSRLERERVKYGELERERARKRMQKRLDAEQRALNEERRRRGLVPIKPVTDPFKKMQDDREKEKREASEQERARREDEEREAQREREREVKAAKARARKAAAGAAEQDSPKVIVVVKGDKEKDKTEGHGPSHRSRAKDKNKPKIERDTRSRSSSNERMGVSPGGKAKSPERDQKRVVSPERKVKETKDLENEGKKEDKHDDLEKDKKAKDKASDDKNGKGNGDKDNEDMAKENASTDVNANKVIEDKNKNKTEKPADNSTKEEKKDNNKEKESKKLESDQFLEKKKRQKSKIIRKSKLERQISNLDYVLNKYEPGRVLGDGNFAVVKTCTMKNSPQEYAMKIVDKAKLKGKEHMIENEIEIMKQCSHFNIVKLMEEFETHNEIYLIMELVKGGDLFDAITQSVKFDEKTSAGMVTDLSNALFYLHSRSIVHRDLKPENLLVLRNKDGSISLKLADFGLAMDVKDPIFTVCGTPTYVAPEILSEIGYGLEVDMWATGVITYILLCGFPPFRSPDRNQTELFEFIKAGEYEFLSPYWDKTSRAAKDLISRLLIVDKKKRYTAIDVLCHPWIITLGGTKAPTESIDTYRKNLRTDLDSQAKLNKEAYVAAKKALKEQKEQS